MIDEMMIGTYAMDECYICCDDTILCDTIRPCLCNSHVHQKCLKKWIKINNKTKCNVCLYEYKYKENLSFYDNIKYLSIIIFQQILLLFGIAMAIWFTSLIMINICDKNDCTTCIIYAIILFLSLVCLFLIVQVIIYILIYYVLCKILLMMGIDLLKILYHYPLFFIKPRCSINFGIIILMISISITVIVSYYLLIYYHNLNHTIRGLLSLYLWMHLAVNIVCTGLTLSMINVNIYDFNIYARKKLKMNNILNYNEENMIY